MKKILIIFSVFAIISCNNDDATNLTESTDLNLVTGINFRQNFDDVALELGNPNVLVNNNFSMYPNPAIETVFIMAQENVTDVWIVPANREKIYQDVDFSNILNTNLYSEESISSNSNISLTGQTSPDVTLNIATLEQGYYKVFVKIGGQIYWDNLYKYEDQGNTEEHINSIIDYWN